MKIQVLSIEYCQDWESSSTIIKLFKTIDDAKQYALENLFVTLDEWKQMEHKHHGELKLSWITENTEDDGIYKIEPYEV